MSSSMSQAELQTALAARLGTEATEIYDEGADLRDGLQQIALATGDPLVHSFVWTLAGAGHGGEEWEPMRNPAEDALWADLRPSEAIELRDAIIRAADRAAARCEAVIIEELTAVGVAFVTGHPDARRHWSTPALPDASRVAVDDVSTAG